MSICEGLRKAAMKTKGYAKIKMLAASSNILYIYLTEKICLKTFLNRMSITCVVLGLMRPLA